MDDGLLYANKALQQFGDVYDTPIEQQQIKLQDLVNQGVITPEQAQVYTQQGSAYDNISTDPRLKNAQLNALQGLQDISSQGGLTAMDRSQLDQIQQGAATQEKGARDAILENRRERGISGGGDELAAQLISQQGSAQRQSSDSLNVAAQAQQRALAALQQSGQLGGQMQAQDFSQQARAADAKDAINKFNTQNQQATENTNVAANNAAQTANLANTQRIADTNTGFNNQAQVYNKGLYQQQYQNQLAKAQAVSGAYGNLTNAAQTKDANDQKFVGGIIGTVGSVAAASDERVKKNIESGDPDIETFLDHLTANKYDYKEPEKHGQGKQVSVMAQDLEKSPVGKSMVIESPEGKKVNYTKGLAAMLAALGNVHHRVSKLEGGK